ncbi:MAG: preprotein translocase subunit YajC [Clostridia bacterium]|nr:preprotein translocase subunit YajC [Clostridia bacterium]MBO7288488.1 preprotein translocase subunit YajC [Clostridia bacterium]
MNLFDLTAYAAPAAAGTTAGAGGMVSAFLPFILIIAVMYFLMIRPQKKKEKLKQEMLSQLIVGDKILTIGGIHGKIVSVKDDVLVIETGEAANDKKSYIKITRWAVSEVTKPGEEPKEKKEEATEIEKLNDNE